MFANLFMQFLYSAVIFAIGSGRSTIYRNKKYFFKKSFLPNRIFLFIAVFGEI